jgi:hypothetical protein
MAVGAALLLLSGCTKEPGEGGKALIRGTILQQDINNNTGQPTGDPYPAQEQKVYIIYGDNDYFDDDIDTDPEGNYEFRWLRKGSYTLFVYSECPTCAGGQEVKRVTVEIGDKKEVLEVPTITIANW